jgi:four helix bundle protein
VKTGSGLPQDMRERTFQYALRIIKLYQELAKHKSDGGAIIGRQLLESGTSVGANIEEAYAGESKKDFIHKYAIALKEAKESRFWLRLLIASNIMSANRLDSLLKETEEIIAIITAILKSSRGKPKQ